MAEITQRNTNLLWLKRNDKNGVERWHEATRTETAKGNCLLYDRLLYVLWTYH